MTDARPTGAPCWIDLMTSDPARSHAFYAATFGWTAGESSEEFGGYAMYLLDGVPVAGVMPSVPGQGVSDAWSVYLHTPDADKLTEVATAAGATTIVPPMPVADLGTMVVLAGPDGAAVGAWQPGSFAGIGTYERPDAPSWFELHTRDHAAAVAFYREAFGWEAETVSDTDEFRYTVLKQGDRQYAGVMDARAFLPEGAPSQWHVYVGAADVDAVVATALEHGGSVVQAAEDTPYGRLAVIADPNGAVVRLVSQPTASAPTA